MEIKTTFKILLPDGKWHLTEQKFDDIQKAFRFIKRIRNNSHYIYYGFSTDSPYITRKLIWMLDNIKYKWE